MKTKKDYEKVTNLVIIEEVQQIINFCKVYTDNEIIKIISLKDNITFKEFSNFFNMNKQELLYLFDEVEKRQINIFEIEN